MNLKCFDINDEIFNRILHDFEADVIRLNKLENKSYYEYRNNIVLIEENNTKKIICQGYILNYYLDTPIYSSWKQAILYNNEYSNIVVEDSIDGQSAWFYMMRIIKKKYTDNQIKSILTSYQVKPDYLKQYHYDWPNESQNVQKLTNCVKYDINGAHTDALCELFPKCKTELFNMYIKRHDNIKYKKYPNFFVGMLKRKGYIGAYWYIVNRTTELLLNAINKVGGQLVYANTDGFCVQNPVNTLNTSDKLGDFKLEFEGSAYIFTNRVRSPYLLYQFGDKLVGSCMTMARKDVDLSKGNVVYYDRIQHNTCVLPENIVKETVWVKEYK